MSSVAEINNVIENFDARQRAEWISDFEFISSVSIRG